MTAFSPQVAGVLPQGSGQIADRLATFSTGFEAKFAAFLPEIETPGAARAMEAMRYGALGGGKRIRPFLAIESGAMVGLDEATAFPLAAAVECIHCYSLIHDDLPAMDDDALRRGRPTVHIEYDEATAILAGDGLLTWAFEILSDAGQSAPNGGPWLKVISKLAQAAGVRGMIGGQMRDIEAESQQLDLEAITQLQRMKTGALIEWSVLSPAVLIGSDATLCKALTLYARKLGLVFQITDDLLDYQGDAQLVGKALGKDAEAGKGTFVTHHGIAGARQRAEELTAEAVEALAHLGPKADMLQQLARFVLDRKV